MLRCSNAMIDEIVTIKFISSRRVAVVHHGLGRPVPATRPI
jgi:hypothetical protein